MVKYASVSAAVVLGVCGWAVGQQAPAVQPAVQPAAQPAVEAKDGADGQAPIKAVTPIPVPLPPSAPGSATPIGAAPEYDETHPGVSFRLSGSGELTFESDLKDTPGDVSVSRAGIEAGVSTLVGDRGRFSVVMGGETSWYDFSGATGLVPGTGDPFNDVYRVGLRASFAVQQTPVWSWFIGADLQWSGEDDVDFSDGVTGGGFGGVGYKFSDTLTMSFGLSVQSRLEDSAQVFPLIGVDWRISDRVRLGAEGPGLRLTVMLNEKLDCFLTGAWESREYRLNSDNLLSDGVVRDERVPIGVGFTWRPAARVAIELAGGAVVWQEYRFDDRNGNRVSEENTDPAGFIRLAGRIEF